MTSQEIKNAITIASNAKDRRDYETANAVFAYLFHENIPGMKYGYAFMENEGAPASLPDNDAICSAQYHGLPFIKYGERSICIPAPCLTATAYKRIVKLAKSKHSGLGFSERVEEHEDMAYTLIFAKTECLNLDNIHLFLPNFYIPSGILEREIKYENPLRGLRKYCTIKNPTVLRAAPIESSI